MNKYLPALAGLALAACTAEPPPERYAVILAGGTVYAGTDAAPAVADVAIEGDRIAAVGDLSNAEAGLRLDVTGLAVAPGFIDIHSHALRDTPETSGLFLYPDAENLIRQGVTTVIGGPDGGSPLPIGESLAMIEASAVTVNFATFVGHGSIRELVVGPDDRPPTAEELEAMKAEVAKAMQEGAYGLSSGLVYAPGKFATTEEVVALAKVAGEHGGIYISHMREEGLELLASVAETIRIGEEGGLPTQLTHHKVVGAPMWGKSAETLAMVDAALARGVDVSIDQYPYTASSTSLAILFPRWALDGDRETRLARLADPERRAEVRAAIVRNIEVDRGGNDPANIVLADCTFDRSLNGLNLSEVLAQRETEITFDNAAELVITLVEAGNCSAVFHAMEENDVVRIMRHPKTMIASDGGIEAPSERAPHPRNYGTFARVLGRYVREQGVMPLHTAIYKMSLLPAERIGLSERGRLEPGAIADIAVFDAAEVMDTATFENPHQYALGMRHVLVNGEPVLLNAEMTGARPGRVLRSQ
ncbi:MAG: D-aminoacylase [Gammaproteobacteria bacterium]|nr:D-aminoacylase [Gammaproteobacteria bacterium]